MFRLVPTPILRSLVIGLTMIALAATLLGSYCLGYHRGLDDTWRNTLGPWPVEKNSTTKIPGR